MKSFLNFLKLGVECYPTQDVIDNIPVKDLLEAVEDYASQYKNQIKILAKIKSEELLRKCNNHKETASQQCKDEIYNLDKSNYCLLNYWSIVDDYVLCS